MKILLAVDGSPFSQAAVEEVIRLPWPLGSEVRVLSVIHPLPYIPALDPAFTSAAAHLESLKEERDRASHDIDKADNEIRQSAPNLKVSCEALEGSPKKMIVEAAEVWGADLIVMGSHGHGPADRFLLGSVAQNVVLHAPCSVYIVRTSAKAAS
jgi:nucleotide-binding universal stress UspA family protein